MVCLVFDIYYDDKGNFLYVLLLEVCCMFGLHAKNIVIESPLDGAVVPVSKVCDPVFSEDVLGRGIAIVPESGCVRAPAKAIVCQMFDTGHAVSLLTDSGVELLIHVGIDTVRLEGRHYTSYTKNYDNVSPGDVLMVFDADAICADGFDTVTPVVVCNPTVFSYLRFAPAGFIRAGEPLITLRV